jgi:hypothetical protein
MEYWGQLSFNWNLDSMSGLRNACIVTAASGASCIIPSFNEKNNPSLLLDSIYETNTTFLIASLVY